MKSNEEIVTEIIKDLENTVGLNWPNKNSKVTKNKLIKCWSEYREVPDYKFYGYAGASGICRIYGTIFSNLEKHNSSTWKNFILLKYGYKYCYSCANLLLINNFGTSIGTISDLRADCKSCTKIKTKNYQENHKEEVAARNKKYRKEHIQYFTEYSKENSWKYNAHSAKYRAAKLERTPIWLTKNEYNKIQDKYILAKELEKQDGKQYHVDHIIPLQGEKVSGLHVPSNLQVITKERNLSKSNNYVVK